MAKALFENRQFTDTRTGEIIAYDFYGIVGIVNGKAREMRFKDLSAAEKLAFEVIAAGDDPVSMKGLEVYGSKGGDVDVSRKAAEARAEAEQEITGSIFDDED